MSAFTAPGQALGFLQLRIGHTIAIGFCRGRRDHRVNHFNVRNRSWRTVAVPKTDTSRPWVVCPRTASHRNHAPRVSCAREVGDRHSIHGHPQVRLRLSRTDIVLHVGHVSGIDQIPCAP